MPESEQLLEPVAIVLFLHVACGRSLLNAPYPARDIIIQAAMIWLVLVGMLWLGGGEGYANATFFSAARSQSSTEITPQFRTQDNTFQLAEANENPWIHISPQQGLLSVSHTA